MNALTGRLDFVRIESKSLRMDPQDSFEHSSSASRTMSGWS